MRTGGLLIAVVMMLACSTAPQPAAFTEAKSPPARGYHFMTGLGPNPGVLLFSGENAPPPAGGHDLGDLWLWRSGTGWTQKKGLDQKWGYAGYDPKAGRVIVLVVEVGKYIPLLENWSYDPGANSWAQRTTDQRPDFVNGAVSAIDAESERVIVFSNDTWAYDPVGNSWQQMHPKNSPLFGSWSALVYDDKRDRLILLGGEGRGQLSDVWFYDFNHDAWSEVDAGSGPSARLYPAAAYEARSGRVILFGGVAEATHSPLNDTWSYDVGTNKWTELQAKTSPPSRGRHAMAFDGESGKIVMFGGGADPFHFQKDTWVFDPGRNEWSRA